MLRRDEASAGLEADAAQPVTDVFAFTDAASNPGGWPARRVARLAPAAALATAPTATTIHASAVALMPVSGGLYARAERSFLTIGPKTDRYVRAGRFSIATGSMRSAGAKPNTAP